MYENKDISWGIGDFFNHLKFKKIGCTGDGNNYPLFVGEKSGYKGVIVGIPVDDYQVITEHLNTIDKKLSRLEDSIDKNKGGHTIIIKAEDGTLSKVQAESQEEYMKKLSGLSIDKKYQWVDDQDEIDFSVTTSDGSVIIETYIHTVLYGEHRAQRCNYIYNIGMEPPPLVEPSSITILDMEEDEIDKYVNRVRDWRKRGEEIKAWSDYKNKVISEAKDAIKVDIDVCVDRQEMIVPKLGLHDILDGYDIIMINPFVFWVSPDERVPDKYRGALKNESRQ